MCLILVVGLSRTMRTEEITSGLYQRASYTTLVHPGRFISAGKQLLGQIGTIAWLISLSQR